MLLPSMLTAFVGLTYASLLLDSRGEAGSITRRQSYPYPAHTIDMPVRQSISSC
jgi:hypothetical protein